MADDKTKYTEYDASLAPMIELQEQKLKSQLEAIAYSDDLGGKKKKVAELTSSVESAVRNDAKTREAVFYVVGKTFFTPGMFRSKNDGDNIEAAIYFYSNFPKDFIDYAFGSFGNPGFRKEILNYYGRTLVRISKSDGKNREYTLKKMAETLAMTGSTEAVNQAKIFTCIDAIAMRATELLEVLDNAKNKEGNKEMKAVFNETVALIKKKITKGT